MYKIVSALYNMTLRQDPNTGAQGIGVAVPNGTVMIASQIWIAPADLYKVINTATVKINAIGDKWALIDTVNGVVKNLWTAVVHNGKTYCTVEEITDTPPPPVPTEPVYAQSLIVRDPRFPTVEVEYVFSRILE